MGKEREAQIDRVNEQVKDLYGPLLSCVTASKSAFDAMIGQHSPDGTKAGFVRAIKENPDSSEAVAYRYVAASYGAQPLQLLERSLDCARTCSMHALSSSTTR